MKNMEMSPLSPIMPYSGFNRTNISALPLFKVYTALLKSNSTTFFNPRGHCS